MATTNQPIKLLDVPLYAQQTGMWCWAASGQMVMKFVGDSGVTQCEQANRRFGASTCCDQPTPPSCVKGGWPEFGQWGFNSRATSSGVALSFDDLRAQIDARRPVAFAWRWRGGGGHMMVATGYRTAGGGWVNVNDPWPPNTGDKWVSTYANWVEGSSWQTNAPHTHWRDYFDITVATAAGAASTAGEPADTEPEVPPMFEGPEEAVRSVVDILDVLGSDGAAPGLGLADVEPANIDIGEPMPVRYVFNDALAAARPGDDADDLVADGEELIYPVSRGGEVRTSIVVAQGIDGWGVRRVGSPNLTSALWATRDQDPGVRTRSQSEYAAYLVPQMYQAFVGHREAGELVLDPVFDDEPRGFRAAARQTAGDVIGRLAVEARSFTSPLPDEDDAAT